MNPQNSTILIVDDEPVNREILVAFLQIAGYKTAEASGGFQAWELLEKSSSDFDLVLLDWMMPGMNGMEVLTRMKATPDMVALPVIMQTAKASGDDVLKGLQAGVYYYLTKPIDHSQMLAIVKTAIIEYQRFQQMQASLAQANLPLQLMDEGSFSYRTLTEGSDLVSFLSKSCPEYCLNVGIGLLELVVNAVEHGNLGISYDEKSQLIDNGNWEEEIEHRLNLPENADKQVEVIFHRTPTELRFTIIDQGKGFNWKRYIEMSEDRAFDNHGRGIAMSSKMSFDSLEYQKNGSVVVAVRKLEPIQAGDRNAAAVNQPVGH